jgi:hypothetical protein
MSGDSSRKVVVSETVFNNAGSAQSNFDNQQFNDFIANKGYEVEIERAITCPCIVLASGNPLSTCMNCGGTGWIHIDLHKTMVLASSMSNRAKYEPWTQENAGTVNISAKAEDRIGFMDSVKFIELESWFTQCKQVKKSSTNKNFFFTTYQPIRVFEIYFFVSDIEPLEFVPEDKYAIDKNKIVFDDDYFAAFLTANQLTTGQVTASIRYTHNPVYYVLDNNRDMIKLREVNNDNTTDLPKINFPVNCVARKAHFVLNAPNFNGDKLFDNTNYSRTYPPQTND